MGRLWWVYGANHGNPKPTDMVITSSLTHQCETYSWPLRLVWRNPIKAKPVAAWEWLFLLRCKWRNVVRADKTSHLVILTEANQKIQLTCSRGWAKVPTKHRPDYTWSSRYLWAFQCCKLTNLCYHLRNSELSFLGLKLYLSVLTPHIQYGDNTSTFFIELLWRAKAIIHV